MTIAAYSFPRKIKFGSGASLNLAEELPLGAKVLVVAGTTVAKSPSGRKVLESIGKVTCTIYTGVPPEPPLETVDELIAIGRKYMVNTVVAIGGGSVIDAAKAAAALIEAGADVERLNERPSSYSAQRTLLCRSSDNRRNRSGIHKQRRSDRQGEQNQEIPAPPDDDRRYGDCRSRSDTDLSPGSDRIQRTGCICAGL